MPYKPEGNASTADFIIVGEAPAKRELEEGRPFAGMAGKVLDNCLSSAGISRRRCYITNVFWTYIGKTKQGVIFDRWDDQEAVLWSPTKGFTEAAMPHLLDLEKQLKNTKCNVFIPLGGPALLALCGKKGITKWRGSILPATLATIVGRKCVPAIHPAAALHGSHLNTYTIKDDLRRARRESAFPEIRRPAYEFTLFPTFVDCMTALSDMRKSYEQLSVDIEVALRQVSRIAFTPANNALKAISIPYSDGGWSVRQEAELWYATALLLEDPHIPKLFMNGMFDIQFLFQIHKIYVQGYIDDIMTAHKIMYPEFAASLAFLTSLYTDQSYYKDMVKHGDIEKEGG